LTLVFRSRFGPFSHSTRPTPLSALTPLAEVRRGDKDVRDVPEHRRHPVDPEGAPSIAAITGRTTSTAFSSARSAFVYMPSRKRTLAASTFLLHPKRRRSRSDAALPHDCRRRHLGPNQAFTPSSRPGPPRTLEQVGHERSGVSFPAMSFLGLYRDPVVAKVRNAATLGGGESPISIAQRGRSAFTPSVPPSDINRTKR